MIDKYKALEGLAATLGVRNFSMKEAGGKVQIAGTTTYALERDLLWDAIKKHAGWENEVAADVRAERTDIHGIHVVKPGESLSKIAELVGFRGELRWDPDKPNGQPRRHLDVSRAHERFGFSATTTLDESLRRTLAWYRSR